jgi:hypothetical protein
MFKDEQDSAKMMSLIKLGKCQSCEGERVLVREIELGL